MAKDPALLFYVSDFLTGTMFMSNEQVGIYIRLLCSQHQHGGFIEKTAFNSLVGDNAIIRTKFIESEDGFYNKRLMEEMGKRSQKSSNLSANARKRWEKEYKGNAIAKQLVMPTEDEDRNTNTNTNTNTGKKKSAERKKGVAVEFVPPSEEDVVQFFLDKGYQESVARQAFEYYHTANWKDSRGKPVLNWKQKMIAVWMKEENKISDAGNGMLSKAGQQSMKNAEIAFRDLRQEKKK